MKRCVICGRERTEADFDYDPFQVLLGNEIGWYSGSDGEICGEDMTKILERQ